MFSHGFSRWGCSVGTPRGTRGDAVSVSETGVSVGYEAAREQREVSGERSGVVEMVPIQVPVSWIGKDGEVIKC